ncbi:GFA family protein [Jiella sp. M17.18]|uniref:GFA family protein n=1 Tax=Jiella sp. M17.18 TaxID=3234247 RepID=UPI0034DE8412
MMIDGGCHCGEITYRAEIDPEAVSICHCTDCQTLSGSPYRVSVVADRDRVTVSAGEPALYVKTADSGRKRLQYFCRTCGSPLFTTGEGEQADRWGIRWGSIRQRSELRPSKQIWCRSAAPWTADIADLPASPQR